MGFAVSRLEVRVQLQGRADSSAYTFDILINPCQDSSSFGVEASQALHLRLFIFIVSLVDAKSIDPNDALPIEVAEVVES